jgi:ribosomal protein S18 acetylase RimI-like enzyme
VGLVVIGVHPAHRGSGIFQLLMQEFEKKALGYNIHKLVLSVKKNNARAIGAYTKQGWFISKENEHTLEMCKNLA